MENNSDKIIINSLMEEGRALYNIITAHVDEKQAACELGKDVITWANNLLMNASKNEPGQVNLIPPHIEEEEPKEEFQRGEHQSIGSGPGRRFSR